MPTMQRQPAVTHFVWFTPLSNAPSYGTTVTNFPWLQHHAARILARYDCLNMLLKTTHHATHCCPLLYQQSRLDVVASQKNKEEPASKLSTS